LNCKFRGVETKAQLPHLHAGMRDRVIAAMQDDERFQALLGSGSMAYGGFDEHFDLDLVLVVRAADHAQAMAERRGFAEKLGPLLAAFSGEHVGEPRLLICLFGPPLLHVDLKHITMADLSGLSERPVVLWARDARDIDRRVAGMTVRPHNRDPQWFEDRAWTRGVRRVEEVAGSSSKLAPTLPGVDGGSIAQALKQSAALYVELREAHAPAKPTAHMPAALLDFIDA
jgi:hypothetical protein